jgi:hypothetical protein
MSKYLKSNEYNKDYMNNKKGLSDIVNTVLMVMLTIAAVGMITVFVFNFVNSNTVSLSDIDLNLKKVEAYYNNAPVTSMVINAREFTETTFVSVERGSDKGNLTGLKFVFSMDGNSYECIRRNVPNTLETTVYAFKSSIFNKIPENVEVIPLVNMGKGERIARSGFAAFAISETGKEFTERFNECGGFCCGANPDLPGNPDLPTV